MTRLAEETTQAEPDAPPRAALAAAYTRRKLAAWRARLNAYLLRRKLATEKAPEESNDAPLPRNPHLLVDGEAPLDEAASGRAPQPGPSRPDGSYTPHSLRDGYAPSRPIDLAAWKQQDYNQLARHQAAEAADRAFDAEVGWPTQQEWLTAEGYATALQAEGILEEARQVCNPSRPEFDVVACNIAQNQAQQEVELLGLEAGLQPHSSWEPTLPPPKGSIAVGIHASGGLPGWYGDIGIYIFAIDTRGSVALLQPFVGGGGTTSFFGEITPVVMVSNAPLSALPGNSVNVGGSIEIEKSFGVDSVTFHDAYGQHYEGVQLSLWGWGGAADPVQKLPVEFHGGVTHTFKPWVELSLHK